MPKTQLAMFTVEYKNHSADRTEITHVLANSKRAAIADVWNASRFSSTVDILLVGDIKVVGRKSVDL